METSDIENERRTRRQNERLDFAERNAFPSRANRFRAPSARESAGDPKPRPRFAWTLTTIVAAGSFFAMALSNDFYLLTSPLELSWHVTLRKVYSVGAFAVVAFLIRQSLAERGLKPTAAAIVAGGAIFSGAIEIGQFYNGSTEGIGWNLTDIGCGAIGGAIVAIDLLLRKRARKPRPASLLARRRRDLRK